MEFDIISEDLKVTPGEYILHEPTQEIVMCGAFNRDLNFIRAIGRGKSVKDEISNFKKIRLTADERQDAQAGRCKGCGG